MYVYRLRLLFRCLANAVHSIFSEYLEILKASIFDQSWEHLFAVTLGEEQPLIEVISTDAKQVLYMSISNEGHVIQNHTYYFVDLYTY